MASNNIQTPAIQQRVTNFFTVGNSILVQCSDSSGSAAVAFPTPPPGSVTTDALISNRSSIDAWIYFGDLGATVAIPADGVPANGINIPAGATYTLSKGNAGYVYGVTASGSASLYISQGYGS